MHGWWLPTVSNSSRRRSKPALLMLTSTPRTRTVDIFQQRRRDSHFSSFFRTIFTARQNPSLRSPFPDITVRTSAKVHVHQTRTSNQFGDTLQRLSVHRSLRQTHQQGRCLGPELSGSLSFGIVIRESTCLDSSVIPAPRMPYASCLQS